MAVISASAVHRAKQQVFVDVPSSPYPHSLYSTINVSAPVTSKIKGNAVNPLRPSNTGIPHSISDITSLKRKISNPAPRLQLTISSTKRQKLTDVAAMGVPQQSTVLINSASNACPEFPNGFAYCHQCLQKRDASSTIYCTSITTRKGTRGERVCNAKFCGPCLKKRYGEDVDVLKLNGSFKCPRCRDVCNCSKCRKLKGLGPTGKFQTGRNADSLVAVTPLSTFTPSASKMKVEVLITTTPSKGLFVASSTTHSAGHTENVKAKPSTNSSAKPTVQKKLKQVMLSETLPVLRWTAVPTRLTLKEAESRFQIREFVLRFVSIMEPTIPKSLLAELEDVGCVSNDDEEMAPWVSEACVRSMVLGLLGLLADKDYDTLDKAVRNAISGIRASGNNLSKIWSILATMRGQIDSDTVVSFPDPLPPPASSTIYNTRSMRSSRDSSGSQPTVTVVHPAQMVPVVEALVEAALKSSSVHEELESGVKEAKEMIREVKEYVRVENERWDIERKMLEAAAKEKEPAMKEGEKVKTKITPEVKVKREAHKHRLQDLENALKLVLPGFAPRFVSLGTDSGGRTFWALSPGARERKAALNFISSATSGFQHHKKTRQRGHALADDKDISATREWSLFVAVWGKQMKNAKLVEGRVRGGKNGNNEDSSDEEEKERWWGFYSPGDIRKVADWLRIDAGIDVYGELDDNRPLATLVKGLKEYAVLLEWRLKDGKYEYASTSTTN